MKPTKIYCDMDGVLVNFESGVYKTIKKYYGNSSLMNTLDNVQKKDVMQMFEDMQKEGTDKSVIAKFTANPSMKETLRVLIGKDKTWWESLDWMPDGRILWEYIKKYNPVILTSDFKGTNGEAGKIRWVKNHLGPEIEIIVADNKGEFAEPTFILVDDRQFVLDGFTEAGGMGLLHVSAKDTINKLEQIFSVRESFRYIKSFKDWNLNG